MHLLLQLLMPLLPLLPLMKCSHFICVRGMFQSGCLSSLKRYTLIRICIKCRDCINNVILNVKVKFLLFLIMCNANIKSFNHSSTSWLTTSSFPVSYAGHDLGKIKRVVDHLRRAHHKASRTHFDPEAIRTDCTLTEFTRLLLEFSKANN